MNNKDRAIRYRKLALAEPDREKAALLNKIADEDERGVLCTADRDIGQQFLPPRRVDNEG